MAERAPRGMENPPRAGGEGGTFTPPEDLDLDLGTKDPGIAQQRIDLLQKLATKSAAAKTAAAAHHGGHGHSVAGEWGELAKGIGGNITFFGIVLPIVAFFRTMRGAFQHIGGNGKKSSGGDHGGGHAAGGGGHH